MHQSLAPNHSYFAGIDVALIFCRLAADSHWQRYFRQTCQFNNSQIPLLLRYAARPFWIDSHSSFHSDGLQQNFCMWQGTPIDHWRFTTEPCIVPRTDQVDNGGRSTPGTRRVITKDGYYEWDNDVMKACSEIYARTVATVLQTHLKSFGGSTDKMLIWDYVAPRDHVEGVSVSFSEILQALPLSRSNLQRKLSELIEDGFLTVSTDPTSGQLLYRLGDKGLKETLLASQHIHLAMLKYGQEYARIRGLSVEECITSSKENIAARTQYKDR